MPLSSVTIAGVEPPRAGAEQASAMLANVHVSDDGTECCFHCGQFNPPTLHWRAVCDGAERRFCCAGCLAVAQTIRAAAHRKSPATMKRRAMPTPPKRRDLSFILTATCARQRCCSKAFVVQLASG